MTYNDLFSPSKIVMAIASLDTAEVVILTFPFQWMQWCSIVGGGNEMYST